MSRKRHKRVDFAPQDSEEERPRRTRIHEKASRKTSNPLINIQTIGVAAIFFVVGFFASFAISGSMNTVTIGSNFETDINKAGETGVDFLNKYMVEGGGVTLKSIEKDGDLFKLTTLYNGNEIPVHMTMDGENVILGGVGVINIADYEAQNAAGGDPPDTGQTQPPASTEPGRVEVSADDDPSIGPDDAPVQIIEFSDFQCPYCARAVPTIKQVIDEYGDQVRVVFRDFPLNFHANAQKAAEAGECADDQGMFWEMHDRMFEDQGALDPASLKTLAGDLGMDTDEFSSCLDSGKYADEVQQDFLDGQKAGVTGTPAFYVNGIKLSGAKPFSAFKQVIDQELALN